MSILPMHQQQESFNKTNLKRLSNDSIAPLCSLTPNERDNLNRSESTKEVNLKVTSKYENFNNNDQDISKVKLYCAIPLSKRTSLQKNNPSTKEISSNVKFKKNLEVRDKSIVSSDNSIAIDYDTIYIRNSIIDSELNSQDKNNNSEALNTIISMVKGYKSSFIQLTDQERLLEIIGKIEAFERFQPSRFRAQLFSEGFTYIDLIMSLNSLSMRMINLVLENNHTINNGLLNQVKDNTYLNDVFNSRRYNINDDITLTLVKIGISFMPIYLYVKSQIVKRLNIFENDSIYPSLNIILQDFILGPAVIQACNCTEILFELSQEEFRKFEKIFYDKYYYNNDLISKSYLDIDILNIGCICLNQDPIAKFHNLFLFQEVFTVIKSNQEYIRSPLTFNYSFDNKTVDYHLLRLNLMFNVLIKNEASIHYKSNVEKKMLKYLNDSNLTDKQLKNIFKCSFSYSGIVRLTSIKLI